MKLEEGKAALPSTTGTFFSFIIMSLLVLYSAQKIEIFINRKDVNIVYSVRDSYYTDTDTFSGTEGFNIAVAFTGFDSVKENILKREYAQIKFNYDVVIVTEQGLDYEVIEMPSHPCTDEELGLQGANSEFMPIQQQNLEYVQLYRRKFLCV